ncbi:hypothetical protein MJO29_007875 [Puccinia striiformis f. sp. tritici]|uniref:Uncharacterized protein n=1 Tax=Puccinia striiformis TaxID=27350 RepID=A0A2S4UZV3_9BASI|nr:hypothetical protein Pst134EA_015991 [Puccinia striiformis f. sp. tritici]KAH9463910.1 hypothetical protein Pst134EA_015991 [Puccinia striiformis f. sp. tritici]KAI7952244.1 hypothetical protein MJO29_007875 [Puccinia striiformis f. sp. tritici]KAI9610704.1 hypothetical protein KEM48_002504 [Puccinia striiformis f. sp. tritici PST-130]POW02781.1 hypothetical protein PSTT_11558 [Puccinia striiformis]
MLGRTPGRPARPSVSSIFIGVVTLATVVNTLVQEGSTPLSLNSVDKRFPISSKHETIYGVGNFHKSDRYFLATTKPTEESGGEDFSTSDKQGLKEKESCSETEPIAIEKENTYQTHQDEKSKQEDVSDNTAGDGEKKKKRKNKKKKKKGKGGEDGFKTASDNRGHERHWVLPFSPATDDPMTQTDVLPQAVLNDRMSATTQIKPVYQTNGNTQHDENHWMEDTDNDIVEAKYEILQQASIRNPPYQGSRVALEVFESSLVAQCYHDIHLNNFYVAGIKAAFQPRETGHDGEIFPNVIKPIWARAIHTEECARLLRESLQNVGIVPHSQEVSQRTDVRDSKIFEAILQILGTQLQTSNLQNHLPLSESSHTTYNKLHILWNMSQESFFQIAKILRIKTKLNEYELHRRLSTLNYQIVQKTAVENWNLIKTALGDRNKKRRVNLFDLKSLQIDFQLDREFPSTLDICKILTERPEKLTSNLRKTKINPLSLMITTMGFEEFRRRFNFLVLGAAKPNMNTQTGLSPGVLEDLRAAEKSNGINVWNVCCFIRCLGLGEPTDFQHYGDDELRVNVENLTSLVACQAYRIIPWYESADRAWLIKTYKNYGQQFTKLCEESRHRSAKDTKSRGKTEGLTVENQLEFTDHGISYKVFLSLKMLNKLRTGAGSNIDNWTTMFDSFPWEFDLNQKEFVRSWFDKHVM